MVEIASLVSVFQLLKNSMEAMKSLLALMPQGASKDSAAKSLMEAKRALEIAESTSAKELGYPLCKCTWPPQIMLFTGKARHFRCPLCGFEIDTSPGVAIAIGDSSFTDALDRFVKD